MSGDIESDAKSLFARIRTFIEHEGFRISASDTERPWGGFFVISEAQSGDFIERFFPEKDRSEFDQYEKLSPKILLVSPGKRLSWQYHHRRAEIWKLIEGAAAVVVSDTNVETDRSTLQIGEILELGEGQRHRLVGLDKWGVVAEIWKHTDPQNPSDEDDIVRLQDDFGRQD